MGRDLRETVGRAYAPYPLPQISIGSATLDWLVGDAKSAAVLRESPTFGSYPGSFLLPSGALRVNLVATTNTIHPYNVLGFIEGKKPGDQVKLTVLRDKRPVDIEIELGGEEAPKGRKPASK